MPILWSWAFGALMAPGCVGGSWKNGIHLLPHSHREFQPLWCERRRPCTRAVLSCPYRVKPCCFQETTPPVTASACQDGTASSCNSTGARGMRHVGSRDRSSSARVGARRSAASRQCTIALCVVCFVLPVSCPIAAPYHGFRCACVLPRVPVRLCQCTDHGCFDGVVAPNDPLSPTTTTAAAPSSRRDCWPKAVAASCRG